MAVKNIAIISIDPRDRGGVRTMVEEAWRFAAKKGRPHLFFLSFEPSIATSIRSLRLSSTTQHGTWEGKSFTAIGARWAFWEPGHYFYTRKQWQQALEGYEYFFVVSGTPIAAHILYLLKKKYVLWIASSYDDDRAQRVQKMSYPRGLINAVARPLMVSIERSALRGAASVCFTSRYTQQLFPQSMQARSGVVGVPLSLAWLDSAQNNQQKPDNHLIAIGRFSDPRKNIQMLLRVFDLVKLSLPQVTLTIIGAVPPSCASAYTGPYKGVTFIEHRISEQELAEQVERASLMLITSYQEGLSIVGIQALAKGVPVVSTDCGGVRDYIHTNKTGLLAAVNDDQAMSDSILSLLNDDRRRMNMGIAGRALVLEKYTQHSIDQALEDAFSVAYPDQTWIDR